MKANTPCESLTIPVLLIPKAAINNLTKAGLLTRFTFCGLPVPNEQWLEVTKGCVMKLTASGNVRDSHPVPFSSGKKKFCRKPLRRQM